MLNVHRNHRVYYGGGGGGHAEEGGGGELNFISLFTQLLNSDCQRGERISDFKERPAHR